MRGEGREVTGGWGMEVGGGVGGVGVEEEEGDASDEDMARHRVEEVGVCSEEARHGVVVWLRERYITRC